MIQNLNRTDPPRRATRAGFTLIEVMVALAVAGLGLGALVAASSTGLGNVALASHYTEAMRRAQSHMALIGPAMPLAQTDQSGDDGNGYFWHVRISQPLTRPAADNGPAPPSLYTIEVTISWKNGVSVKSVVLQSQRLGPAPAAAPG